MSIREKVKQAMSDAYRSWGKPEDSENIVDAAITAFLEAAAEQGFRMRPDEATEEMQQTFYVANTPMSAWRFFCKAAPKFEWDK